MMRAQYSNLSILRLSVALITGAGVSGAAFDVHAEDGPSWGGMHVGVFAGWQGHDPDISQRGDSLYVLPDPGANGVGNDLLTDTSALGAFGSAAKEIASGGSAGGFAGYSLTRSRFFFGVEGDFGTSFGSDVSVAASGTIAGTYDTTPIAVNDTASASGTQSLGAKSASNFGGSLRARIGVLVTPSILFYGTGGAAFADFDRSATVSGSVTFTNEDASSGTHTFSGSGKSTGWDAGWTAGSGIEAKLTDNWSLRAEYRYSSFGSETLTVPVAVTSAGSAPAASAGQNVGVRFEDTIHSARIGISYNF